MEVSTDGLWYRADVLVATPGRLVDLLENGGIRPRFAKLGELVLISCRPY